ncbi:RNase A-like domain-containing protein [Streptomyces sp. NPDC012888]|uniref:RNase A-like domain-containing protein n=1 Tax=Streptomyces sp. NPDC012888 TaxID=3364855 RepID=UPI0036B07829
MSVEDEVKDVLIEMGMWWPDANSGSLRAAAGHWRTFADAVDDVLSASNGAAGTLMKNNTGEAIDAFTVFWGRYHADGGKGWLDNLAAGSRQMAAALEEFADVVDDAIERLWTQIGIAAATIAAGIGLAVFTFGLSTAASAAAATAIIELAAGLGVTVSATVANIAAVTLTGVVFGSIESVTVELAVAQPLKIAAGLQDGFDLSQVDDAAKFGGIAGGLLGGGASTLRAVSDAGGFVKLFQGIPLHVAGPPLALPRGMVPVGPHVFLRQGDYNAWPRSKRKGAVQPKHRADLKGDEGKNGSHTLDRHVEMTTRDLRARLRANPGMDAASRFLDESSAQRFVDDVLLRNQKTVSEWLNGSGKKLALPLERFDDVTGLSLSRENFKRGTPAEEVYGVKVILKKDPDAPAGYRILTAYPQA